MRQVCRFAPEAGERDSLRHNCHRYALDRLSLIGQSEGMFASRATRVMTLVVVVIGAACSSSRSATQVVPSATSGGSPHAFCDLYRRDAGDGRLRNWNLTANGKTPSYTETLRALADAAPPELKSDIVRILSYYAAPHPQLSAAE
jgi:hypothetical protein